MTNTGSVFVQPPAALTRSAAAHLQALMACHAELADTHEGLKLYAIVDTGQHFGILKRISELQNSGRANLFEGMPEEAFDNLTPWLLQLDTRWLQSPTPHQSLLRLCELAQANPCVSWLFSAATLQPLAEHLRKWFNGIILENDGSQLGAVLVRYYDARTLPGFFAMLSPAQHAEFMQPIAAYGLWTRFNTWKQWVPGVQALIFPAPIPEYTLEQHANFAYMTRTDKLHAMLDEHYGPEAQPNEMSSAITEQYLSLPQDERYRTLHRLRGRAESQGITAEPDQFLFASLALGIHAQFDHHPEFARVIAEAVATDTPLSNALAALPESAWLSLDAFSSTESD